MVYVIDLARNTFHNTILYKWNTDASKLEARHAPMIKYVYKDNIGQVQYSHENLIGVYPVLLTETLVIRNAIIAIIQERKSNVIMVHGM